jgi:diketogulonate reductase-like aldo/keto reductase
VVSKVYPHNAGRKSAIAACERSLKRLGTDRLDLYLCTGAGRVPLGETVDAFERLRAAGKILRWGVSNFDTADMRELFALAEGRHCSTNQVLYHLAERGIEWELLPWLRERRMPLMAYSPLGQGSCSRKRKLLAIARDLASRRRNSRCAGSCASRRHRHSGIVGSRPRAREPRCPGASRSTRRRCAPRRSFPRRRDRRRWP